MKLVYVENDRPITDSLIVSETFGKEHRNVMRDIGNQIEKMLEAGESQFVVLNFERIPYQDVMNREQFKYHLTEDAFAIIAMAYTTVEAMKFKINFLTEFNKMKMEILHQHFTLPRNYSEALRFLATSEEEKQTLVDKIEADKPLVHFAESLQISKDSILVSDLAKLLKQNGIDIGEKRFFKYLREEGYLIKSGSEYNMPTQRSMDLKIFEIKMGSRNSSDGTIKITRTPKVTGKGQMYFINKLKGRVSA